MKLLYACGDSWTAGQEIPRKLPCTTEWYYHTWPWFTMEKLNLSLCINEGAGAASNDYIFRKTNNFILNWIGKGKSPKNLIVIVGWTIPERTEICIDNNFHHITAHSIIGKNSQSHNLKNFQQIFYKIYDEKSLQIQQIRYMLILRNLCAGLGIKYYDFIAFGTPVDKLNYISNREFNQGLINLYPTSWKQYIEDNDHSRFQYGHPTIETHKLWADEISRKIEL